MRKKNTYMITLTFIIMMLVITVQPASAVISSPQRAMAAPAAAGIKTTKAKSKQSKVRPIRNLTLTRSADKKKITVDAKFPQNATGMQIAFKTKSARKFKTIKTKKQKYTINVKAKKDYLIKVRAYRKSGRKFLYGKWSTPEKSVSPKYNYTLHVLNKYPIYNGDAEFATVILYLETNNPNGSFSTQFSDGDYFLITESYKDLLLDYNEIYDNWYRSKSGSGYVGMFGFNEPGEKTFNIIENIKGQKTKVASATVTINDAEKREQEFCQQAIKELTESGKLTNTMNGIEKVNALFEWVDCNFRYTATNGADRVVKLASRAGSIYDTRQGTCIGNGAVLCILAKYIGYEAWLEYGGYLEHFDPVVQIDGTPHKYFLYTAANPNSGDVVTEIDYLVK